MPADPQRLLIVEEALKNRRGHWYEYNRAIVEEARRRGVATTLLAHRDIEADLCRELDAEPFFPVTSWDGAYNHPAAWRRYLGTLRHNRLVAASLSRHFASHAPYDVVLAPTVVLHHWLGWRWLAHRGCGRWFRKLVLTTRNNAGEYDPAGRTYRYPAAARVMRPVVHSFAPLVRAGKVELASDSARLAAQYTEYCGVPFVSYPHPRPTAHLTIPQKPAASGRPLVFTALGPPRHEKGSDLILDAIRLVRRQRPDLSLRFVLQWTGHVPEAVLGEDLESDPQIEFIRHDLSTAEYQQRLEAADVLLVPYRRAQYYARLSGVAIEAFQSGVPCLCVSDTWVADSMAAIGSGVAIGAETAGDVAKGIIEMAEDYPRFRTLADERIPLARQTHSPVSFVDQLLAAKVPAL